MNRQQMTYNHQVYFVYSKFNTIMADDEVSITDVAKLSPWKMSCIAVAAQNLELYWQRAMTMHP